MKIKFLLIGLSVFALIVLISLLNSCSWGKNPDKALSIKIIQLSRDKEISKTDYETIKQFIMDNQSKNEEFQLYLLSDSALFKRIRMEVDPKVIDIYFPVTVPAIEMGNINFYIETSMSMGGYMNRGTNFQDVGNMLIGLLRDTGSDDKQGRVNYVNFYPNTISARLTSYDDIDNYARDLTNSRFQISGSSPLNEIFRIIADSSRVNDINVLLTDGIMSGTDAEIQQDPDFNLKQREYMSNQIRSIFIKQKERDWGLAIYAFRSNFNAEPNRNWAYFTYNNSKLFQNFVDRPFYAFVFGHMDIIEQIKTKIEEHERLSKLIDETSYFGLKLQNASDFVLFNSCFKETNRNSLIKETQVLCQKNPSNTQPVEFGIALNLSSFPEHMQTLEYLNRYVVIEQNNEVITDFEVLDYPGDIQDKLSRQRELPKLLKFGTTHYIKIRITGLLVNETELTVKIMKGSNNWYDRWSTDDDSDIASNVSTQKKTFNLKYLIQGFHDAYFLKGKALSTMTIQLINK
jgi:hypothetical protein